MEVAATFARGEALHQAGDLAGAEDVFRAIVRSQPDHADAWFMVARICQATGRNDEAIAACRRAIAIRPDHLSAWHELGQWHLGQKQLTEAELCYRRVARLQPGDVRAASNLNQILWLHDAAAGIRAPVEVLTFEYCCRRGYEHCQNGDYRWGGFWLEEALEFRPDSGDLLSDLGKVMVLQSRLEDGAALFRRAIAADPGNARAHVNLAATLLELGQLDDAERAARRAVELEPSSPSGYNNLGLILAQMGRLSAAEDAYLDGLRLEPEHPEIQGNLANALVLQGRPAEAISWFDRALERNPNSHAIRSNRLLSLHYLPDSTPDSLFQAHREWDLRHGLPLRSTWRPFDNDPNPDRPLRLGFVSGDFQRHPVGYFFVRAIEGLKGLHCETFCYHNGPGCDDLTRRIAAASTGWRLVRGMFDDELADRIRADRIDLLFDLSGHTSRNRLMVFARKPAPIQLTWIGYEGTTGLSAIDYLVADFGMVPKRSALFCRETVLPLTPCYLCYDPPADAPDVEPPPSLRKGYVTFGCFNNPAKIGPDVVAAWAEILDAVPDSRLFLKYRGLDDERVRGRFRGLFASHGIDPARVEIEGWSPMGEMLAAYHRVDIALDPFPFSGCLTTCLALWMGVPVVTLAGETFAGRHSYSVLSTVGSARKTAAHDPARYTEIAVELASDRAELAAGRASLRPIMAASRLCDGRGFADTLLLYLRHCWHEWCKTQGR